MLKGKICHKKMTKCAKTFQNTPKNKQKKPRTFYTKNAINWNFHLKLRQKCEWHNFLWPLLGKT